MRVLTIAVVLVLAFAAAGCGGGDDEASGDTDTTTLETTTDETTTEDTTDETTTDGDEDPDASGLLSGDCEELVEAGQALGAAFAAAGSEADLGESGDAFAAFADEAPEEIRADLQVMAEVYDEYIDAIRDAGIEAGETPSAEDVAALQQALASVDLEEFNAASQRFNAWATANC